MAKVRLALLQTEYHAMIASIEMDEDLLKPEADIVDPKTLTLRSIKHGAMCTLIPIEDHTVATLRRVKQVYDDVTTKPMGVPSSVFGRMDSLLDAVGLLFGTVEYLVVENKDDLDKIINPPKSGDYEPKKVKYSIMDDLLMGAEAKTEQNETPTE